MNKQNIKRTLNSERKNKYSYRSLKKGDLFINNGLGMILSIIGIALLILLGVHLYQLFTQDNDMQKGKEQFDQFTYTLSTLREGEEVEYLLLSPPGWVLMHFRNEDPFTVFPRVCLEELGTPCYCFCKSADACSDYSYCISDGKGLHVNDIITVDYLVENGYPLLIKKDTEGVITITLQEEKVITPAPQAEKEQSS